MAAMRVLALDLSLTATGWATFLDDDRVRHGTEKGPGKQRGTVRLQLWRDWLVGRLQTRYDLAVIEGYAMGARGRAVFNIGEWGGVARLVLLDHHVPTVEVAPATLKKFATGRGNAPKPDMRMELFKRTDIDVADDNTVDALWLLAAAKQAAGEPLWSMPKVNVEALTKVSWPTVEVAAP